MRYEILTIGVQPGAPAEALRRIGPNGAAARGRTAPRILDDRARASESAELAVGYRLKPGLVRTTIDLWKDSIDARSRRALRRCSEARSAR